MPKKKPAEEPVVDIPAKQLSELRRRSELLDDIERQQALVDKLTQDSSEKADAAKAAKKLLVEAEDDLRELIIIANGNQRTFEFPEGDDDE